MARAPTMERGRNRRPTRIGDGATETGAPRRPSISRDKQIDAQRAQSLSKFTVTLSANSVASGSISGQLKAASVPNTRAAACLAQTLDRVWRIERESVAGRRVRRVLRRNVTLRAGATGAAQRCHGQWVLRCP